MKFMRFVVMLFCVATMAYGQDVPKGVRYKKATEEVNSLAKSRLETALATTSDLPNDLFGDVFVVGPMLWNTFKARADRHLLNAKPVIMVIPGKSQIQTEGRAIRTEDEKKAFWKQLRSEYASLKSATIRKGKADEISYFWATIPFDIEEPFLVIDAGTERFIVNFQIDGGKPRLFWIDLVGDFEKLKP